MSFSRLNLGTLDPEIFCWGSKPDVETGGPELGSTIQLATGRQIGRNADRG